MNQYVLITGCTSGIGLSLAKEFAIKGHNLVLVARNKEKLELLLDELKQISPNILTYTIIKDLSITGVSKAIYEELENNNIDINVLCNNAGVGLFSEFVDVDIEKNMRMLNLNINTLVELTYYYANKFKTKKEGYILNVASTGAFVAGPMMSCYYASKAFVLSFSEALSLELKKYNINVSCLCPGTTKTEFFAKASEQDLIKNIKAMDPDKVAKIAYEKLFKNKVIIIPGFKNKLALIGNKLISRKLSRKIIFKFQIKRCK